MSTNIEKSINQEEINSIIKDFKPYILWKGKRVYGELGSEAIQVFLKKVDTSNTKPVIYYKKVFGLFTTLRQRDCDGRLMNIESIIDSPRWVRINKQDSNVEIWNKDSGKDLFVSNENQVCSISKDLFNELCNLLDKFEDLKDLRKEIINKLRKSGLNIYIESLQISKRSLEVISEIDLV